jgi:hypothetical protein
VHSKRCKPAYAAYPAADDAAGAAGVARMLGGMHGVTSGNWSPRQRMDRKGQVSPHEYPDEDEPGWLALTQGMFESHRTTTSARLQEAHDRGFHGRSGPDRRRSSPSSAAFWSMKTGKGGHRAARRGPRGHGRS